MATAIQAGSMAPVDAGAAIDEPATSSRLATLDFIRGVAVLGILATNILQLANLPGAHRWLPLIGEPVLADKLLWAANYLFVDGKLRGLFAMLFGAGLVLFMDRARGKGVNPYWLQFRRLFWLALFGLMHFFLFFEGDILFHYALFGMVVMFLVRLPVKLLLIGGMLLYVADSPLASLDLGGWARDEARIMALPSDNPERVDYFSQQAEDIAEAQAEGRLLAEGSLPEIVAERVEHRGMDPINDTPFMIMDSLACMLFGAALFRMGFFSGGWDYGYPDYAYDYGNRLADLTQPNLVRMARDYDVVYMSKVMSFSLISALRRQTRLRWRNRRLA